MDSSELRICRFCFSSPNALIDIFAGSEANMLDVINKHIGEVNPIKSYVNIDDILRSKTEQIDY